MSILITAMALAAAPAPVAVQPAAAPATHAEHGQSAKPDTKPQGEGCSCCKDMVAGSKMECCAKHGEGHGEHSGHDASH